jgi:hypothetical protein
VEAPADEDRSHSRGVQPRNFRKAMTRITTRKPAVFIGSQQRHIVRRLNFPARFRALRRPKKSGATPAMYRS